MLFRSMLGNGVYTAKITVEINGENGTKETQTIVIPFTIANPVSYTHLDVYKRQILCGRRLYPL